MGDDKKKEESRPLSYIESTDFKKGEKGIKAVVVSNETQLIEAGIDKESAKLLVKNLITDTFPKANQKYLRIMVVKDANDKPVRVFSGMQSERISIDGMDGGRLDSNLSAFYPPNLSLTETVDLTNPGKTVKLSGPNWKTLEDPQGDENFELRPKHVDEIQKAIKDNKLSKANERNPQFDELLQKGATQVAAVTTGVAVPNTPLASPAGKGGNRSERGQGA